MDSLVRAGAYDSPLSSRSNVSTSLSFHELEDMIEELEEMRLVIVQQSPAKSQEKTLNAAYNGIHQAQKSLRALCRCDQADTISEGLHND